MTKRITIYPIQCQLTRKDGSNMVVNIIKLSSGGVLINSLAQPMKVNDVFKASFVLPIKNTFVETEAVVYKTYDQFKGQHGLSQPGDHIAELTFKNPSPDTRKAIHGFLSHLQLSRL